MPDTKVSALTDGTTANSTDRIPVARDAGGGTFNNRYVTPGYIGTTLLGSGTALTGSTVTTSSPVLNLSQTWNAGAVTFTGLKFNATDTASASGSLLLDLQVGGVSQFNITKAGAVTANGNITAQGSIIYQDMNGTSLNNFGLTLAVGQIAMRPGVGQSVDLTIRRAAAATLVLGAADAAAPVAQFFKVQGVVAGTTNTAGANFTIQGSQGTGTGAGGSIIFQVAPAGSNGTAQNAYSTALTIDSTRLATFSNAIGLGAPGSVWRLIPSGTTSLVFWDTNNSDSFAIGPYNQGIAVTNAGSIGWSSNTSPSLASRDVILTRDAANTLALRNGGTNASPVSQQFNVYKFWVDASNYSRLEIGNSGDANTHYVYATQAGTGAARDLLVGTSGAKNILFYTNANPRWFINSNGHLLAGATGAGDNTYDIGVNGANRPRNVYVGTSLTIGTVSVPVTLSASGNSRLLVDSNTVQIGLSTASGVALNRSGTTLQVLLGDVSASAALEALSLKTGAPAGGTSGTWKLGVRVAATTTLDTTQYIEVDVGGTLYKLAVVTS